MRVHFADEAGRRRPGLARDVRARWRTSSRCAGSSTTAATAPRILVAVSREGHCLNDLLYRWRTGAIDAEIVGVASSTRDHAALVAGYGVPYHALPGPEADVAERDRSLLELVDQHGVELVVLARYMQVLGTEPRAARWPGGRSTSTTRSCPRSRARARMPRPTRAA